MSFWHPPKIFHPFPLLRLPYVGLVEVLKSMRIMELLELTETSKKMVSFVKRCNTKTYQLDVELLSDSAEIHIYRANYSVSEVTFRVLNRSHSKADKTWTFGNETVPATVKTPYKNCFYMDIDSFHPDIESGLILILEHLISVFGIQIRKADTYHHVYYLSGFADWLLSRQNNIEELGLRVHNEHEYCMVPILDKFLEKTEKLHLILEFSESFEYTFKNNPKEISIVRSPWFTMKQLLALEFEKLYVKNSNFTNEDLDLIVNKWKKGDFSKLKHLVIVSNNFDNETPVGDLMPPILSGRNGKNKDPKRIVNFAIDVKKDVKIKKDDESIGWMHLNTTEHRFSLYICD